MLNDLKYKDISISTLNKEVLRLNQKKKKKKRTKKFKIRNTKNNAEDNNQRNPNSILSKDAYD